MAALHEDAQALIDMMVAADAPFYSAMTPEAVRAYAKQFVGAMAFPPAAVGSVEDIELPGGLRARLYRPASAPPVGALLFLHGGGWVVGDLDSHDDLCRRLCHGIGCILLALDYRLAPEHVFPAAVEDSFAALRWLHDHAEALGITLDRIMVGGDSAGGNLAAVTAIAARDGLVPPVAYQMLLYPVTDLSTEHPSYARTPAPLALPAENMRWFREQYLAKAEDALNWRASPLLTPSLTGVAPAFLLTLQHDPLCDEGLAYAARLVADGVGVTHIHFAQHMHGLASMGGMIRDAAAAVDMAIASVSAALRAPLFGRER